jgi:two-component system, sensor histidine kinase RegB
LVSEWIRSRNAQYLSYEFHGDAKIKIIFDEVLTHAFFNILDNAYEESPQWIGIDVALSEKEIVVVISDRGKGFDDKVLREVGKPNLSTKNSSGLGLFLAINILARIGGRLEISNLTNGGGSQVKVTIPLQDL